MRRRLIGDVHFLSRDPPLPRLMLHVAMCVFDADKTEQGCG